MWQADNDAYQLWRLRQELEPRTIDPLLESVTRSDRGESPAPIRYFGGLLGQAKRRFSAALYSSSPTAAIVRRPAE